MDNGQFVAEVNQQEEVAHIAVVAGKVFLPDADTVHFLVVRGALEVGLSEVEVDVFLCGEMPPQAIDILLLGKRVVSDMLHQPYTVCDHSRF